MKAHVGEGRSFRGDRAARPNYGICISTERDGSRNCQINCLNELVDMARGARCSGGRGRQSFVFMRRISNLYAVGLNVFCAVPFLYELRYVRLPPPNKDATTSKIHLHWQVALPFQTPIILQTKPFSVATSNRHRCNIES